MIKLLFCSTIVFLVGCSSFQQNYFERKIASDELNFFPQGDASPKFNPCSTEGSKFRIFPSKIFNEKVLVMNCEKDNALHVYMNNSVEKKIEYLNDIDKKSSAAYFFIEDTELGIQNRIINYGDIDLKQIAFYYSKSQKCGQDKVQLNFTLASKKQFKINFGQSVETDICLYSGSQTSPYSVNIIASKSYNEEDSKVATVVIATEGELVGVTIAKDNSYTKQFLLSGEKIFPRKCGDGFLGAFFYPNSEKLAMFYANPRINLYDLETQKFTQVYNATSNTGGSCVGYIPSYDFAEKAGIKKTYKSFVWTNFSRKENKFVATEIKY